MARRRREVDATFRCLDEDGFLFPGKRVYEALDAGEEPGAAEHIQWVEVRPRAYCPHDPLHRIELVE